MSDDPKPYEMQDEKNVGMNANHVVRDSSSDDGGASGEKEEVVDSNKLKRQLKNRHIAMIRLVDYLPHRTHIC